MNTFGAIDCFSGFACEYGRAFYGLPTMKPSFELVKTDFIVPKEIEYVDDDGQTSYLVPFLAGKTLNYTIKMI